MLHNWLQDSIAQTATSNNRLNASVRAMKRAIQNAMRWLGAQGY